MNRSEVDLCREAIEIQDACNLSGVAQSFARAMKDLHALPTCQGTGWIRNHPVSVLFADKIAHLTDTQTLGNDVVSAAYSAAYAIVATERK